MTSRPGIERDDAWRALRRLGGVLLRSGLWTEAAHPLGLLGWALRQGLDVRTLHAVYAAAHPDRLALVDAHRAVTYAELDAEVNRLAHALRDRFGVRRGAPAVMMMENRVEYLVAWFALFRLGASGVHAGVRLTADELIFQLEHSGARVVLASEETWPVVREAAARRPDLGLKVVLAGDAPADGAAPWEAVLSGARRTFPRRSRLGRLLQGSRNIVYTSGTTGRPKGAVRDFGRYGLLELSRILERLPLRSGDRHLLVAPLYHSGAQVFTLLQSALGATIFLRPHFEAQDALESLSRRHIHSVFLVPTMIHRILDLPATVHRRTPTPELRALVSGAAPFPTPLRERAIARFGARVVHDFYGATELGWVTLANGEEMQARPGTVGRPLAGQEVRIERDDGAPAPVGEVGRVAVRNAQVMSGYLEDRQATRETRRRGFATVDDLGRLDADGYLYLAGRARDLVITGGVNVYPAEVEDVLLRHPAVKEAAVIGVPDPDWGERLVAVVVPTGEAWDPAELESFARAHLSPQKVPRRWERVERLPLGPTGKVVKTRLEARFGPKG